MTQEKLKRIRLIVSWLFWPPLLISGLLVAFRVIPKSFLWWHAGILAAIFFSILIYGLACGLIVYAAFRSKPNGFLQRLAFPIWMRRLKSIAPTLGPLIAFPYVLQLDNVQAVFKKEGLQAAQETLSKWCDEMPNRMESLIVTLAAMKKTKKEQ